MIYRTILTAASVIALTAAANAADLGGYKGGPSYAAINWSGLYGGVNAGYGSGSSSDSVGGKMDWSYDISNTVNGVTTTSAGSGTTAQTLSKSFDSNGGIGGGQIGYNVQNGRIVYGVEGDLDASGITGSGTSTVSLQVPTGPTTADTVTAKATAKSQLNYVGTIRGRLGYTFDSALIYATGGLAFGDASDTLTETDIGGTTTKKSKSSTLTGYVLGAGAEYALNPAWSIKGEYQYIDLGSVSLNTTTTANAGNDAKLTDNHTYNTFRVGLNYHVGAGYDPLK